jgi:tetratricopeptide (TPR) repeat protein
MMCVETHLIARGLAHDYETEFDTMARTLSHIARCAAPVLISLVVSLASSHLCAQNELELTPPTDEVENPFRSNSSQAPKFQEQEPTPESPQSTSDPQEPTPKHSDPQADPQIIHRAPVTYQNPFRSMSKLPPTDASLRPGPMTRWQPAVVQHDEHSPIKSSVLSSEAADTALPAIAPSQPDAVQFHTKSVVQAPSLPGPSCVLRPSSVDPPTLNDTFNEPIAAVSLPQTSAAILSVPEPMPTHALEATPTPSVGNVAEQTPSIKKPAPVRPTPIPPLPDSIRLTPKSLIQPSSLTAQSSTLRPDGVSPPLSAAFSEPIAAFNVAQQSAAIGPTQAPEHAAQHTSSITGAFDVDLTKFVSSAPIDSPLIAADPADTAESWYEQAQAAASNSTSCDDLAAVIELCNRGMRSTPDEKLSKSLRRLSAWAHNRRGELQADAGEAEESLNDFQAAVALDPVCSLAIHNRAVSLAQQNQFEAALRDFNRVIELNPGLAVACRNRAELLAAIGRMDDAVADYNRAIEGLPDDPALYCGRAYAHQRLGHFREASADLNRALDFDPNDPEALTQRGNLAAEQGDFVKAAKSFQRAIAAGPTGADAYRGLAWLLATCPDPAIYNPQQAIAEAEQAVKLSHDGDFLVLDTLATARASAGQFKQAIEIEQKAIAAAPPEHALALKQRLDCYHRGIAYRPATSRVRPASHESSIDSSSSDVELR